MPMGRRADVHHVGVGETDDLAEIARAERGVAAGGLDLVHAVPGVVVIDVAHREHPMGAFHMVAEVSPGAGDAAATDDDVVQRLARRDETAPQHMAGDDGETDGGNSRFAQEGTTGQSHGGR